MPILKALLNHLRSRKIWNMKFIEIAVILLILVSSSVKSDEIKGTMEITILVILSTSPFAVNDYPVIHTLANTVCQFIFGNMPQKNS